MGILALWSVLQARKFLIAWSVFVAVVIALAAGIIIPKEYESTSKVQVDALQKNPLTGLFEPRVRVAEFLGQQSAIAGSRTVALEVIDRLVAEGFFVMSDFEAEWRKQTGGELIAGNDARLWAADQLLEKLTIKGDALESTLSISFRADDPAQTARITNAFAGAYMKTIMDQRKRRAARKAASFSDETRSLEQAVEQAQRALTVFREESGFVGLGAQRLEAAEVDLAAVTMRLAGARADLSEAQSLYRQAREADSSALLTLPLPDEAQSGRQAQARLGGVLAQLKRISERYGEKYPDYIEARNEKRALEQTIMRAIANRAEYAERRVAALTTSAAQQKIRAVALQETKQLYDALEDKVETSRQTYDLVATRSLQESLQSRVDSVDVFLLARAVPADKPVTPPLFLILLIGVFVGLGLGAGAAVSAELLEGRIRDEKVLAHLLRAPSLVELTLPAQERLA